MKGLKNIFVHSLILAGLIFMPFSAFGYGGSQDETKQDMHKLPKVEKTGVRFGVYYGRPYRYRPYRYYYPYRPYYYRHYYYPYRPYYYYRW